jgi:hypothetical protein
MSHVRYWHETETNRTVLTMSVDRGSPTHCGRAFRWDALGRPRETDVVVDHSAGPNRNLSRS